MTINFPFGVVAQVSVIDEFISSFLLILDPLNFLLILLAVLFGMLLGILPGVGGVVALALIIPLTFPLDPLSAFMVLAATAGATTFAGSITSILINTPGQAPNAATLIDGFPMSRQGRAGEAIGASAAASAFGALFGILIFVVTIPFMLTLIYMFGPPETFWLALWGLTIIAVIVKGSIVSGLISAAFGVLFAIHGMNPMTASVRWDYGFTFMRDGMPLVPALIGLFAVAEMIKLVSQGGTIAKTETSELTGGHWKGVKSVWTHRWLFMRSALIGAIIGVVPGVGGAAANFIAYFQAVQTSPDPEAFGTGDVRGVIAPEASNDAKDGTSLMPTLGLGIPGSTSMAVLLGAFVLHGITPGPRLFQNHLDVVTIIIVALLISNFLTSIIGLTFANKLIHVTRIDIRLLAPVVLVIAFMGTYAIQNNIYLLFIAMLFGIIGYVMIKVNMSRVPMILGIVLGSVVERNFFRSLQMTGGDYAIFVRSPLTILLILLVVVSLLEPWIRSIVRKQNLLGSDTGREFSVDEEPSTASDEQSDDGQGLFSVRPVWFSVGFYLFLFGWGLYLLLEAWTYATFEDYFFAFLLVPLILVLIPIKISMIMFPNAIRGLLPYMNGHSSSERKYGSKLDEQSVRPRREREKYELLMAGWVVLLPVMMYGIGLGWAIVIFVLGFSWYFIRDLKITLLTTLTTFVFIYVLFVFILNIIIWGGVLNIPDPFFWINNFL